MRTRRWFGVSVLTLVVAAGFTISGSVTAAASSTSDLYVDNTASAHCSDAGGGTITRPFCTIGAASGAVRAGQTVIVTGTFDERLIAKRSGQPGAPITFQAGPTGAKLTGAKAGVTIRYRHDVDVAGFDIAGGTAGPSILVGHSSRITIKDVNADATASASPAIDMVADQDSSIVGSTGVVTQPATGVILDAGTST